MEKTAENLPDWTEAAGGRDAWKKWLEGKVNSCVRRASKWAEKRGIAADDLPTPAQWRTAIRDAILDSQGISRYSGFPLSLAPPAKSTDWNWPSVEHLETPDKAVVALETRLVNDMKSIMSEPEFKKLIGHLASILKIDVRIDQQWNCGRSFGVEQPDEEPALPQ